MGTVRLSPSGTSVNFAVKVDFDAAEAAAAGPGCPQRDRVRERCERSGRGARVHRSTSQKTPWSSSLRISMHAPY